MPKLVNLTPASVEGATARIGDKQTPGLFVERRPRDRSLRFLYKRRISKSSAIFEKVLGDYPAVTIAAAREAARGLNDLTRAGIDPRTPTGSAITVDDAHADYIDACTNGIHRTANKKRTIDDKKWQFKSQMKPLHGKLLADITEDDLELLVRRRAKGHNGVKGSKVQANRLLAEIRCFFNWCASKGSGIKLRPNPAYEIGELKSDEGDGRERILSPREIALFLPALVDEPAHTRRAALLMLLSGCRRQEVTGAESCEVTGHWWKIPAARMKGGTSHNVLLGEWGQALLRQTNSRWIVASTKKNFDGPCLYGWVKVRNRINARMEKAAGHTIENWTWHDLRRTMRSTTAELGIEKGVAEAMMAHKLPGLEHIYDRSDKSAPTALGWAKWEQYIIAIAREQGVGDALGVPATKEAIVQETPLFRFA